MGCWDIFCLICGNPCHGILDGTIDAYEEEILEDKLNPKQMNELKQLKKKSKWMNKCTMLVTDGSIIHNLEEINCNVTFCNSKICVEQLTKYTKPSFIDGNFGVFLHTDCWKFIKKNYKVELSYNHLPKLKLDKDDKLLDINYGDVEKYWNQDFEFGKIVIDKKTYLCSSPLSSDKNLSQIKKNISKLNLKNDPKRIGPLVSATFYKSGDIKVGKNKKLWIIKNNKWSEINEKVIDIDMDINITKLKNNQLKFLKELPFSAQFNVKPIFISSTKSNKKDIFKMNFIMTESFKDKFDKIMNI